MTKIVSAGIEARWRLARQGYPQFGMVAATAVLVLGGCVAGTGGVPSPASAAGTSPESLAPPASEASAASSARPTLVVFTGLPDDATGRAFAINRSDGTGAIGIVGRTTLDPIPAGQRLIGLRGSSVITAARDQGITTVSFRDLSAGADAAVVSGDAPFNFAVPVPGGVYLAANDPDKVSVDLGVSRWNSGSSDIHVVVEAGAALKELSVRSLISSPDGSVVVSPLVTIGVDPSIATVIDGSSGKALRSLQLEGEPTSMTNDTLLVRTTTGIEGVDVESGKVRWVLDGPHFGLGYARSSSFVVTDELVDPQPTFRLLDIDATTGKVVVRFTHPYDGHWSLWPEFSTEEAAVVSPDGWFPEAASEGGDLSGSAVRLGASTETQNVGVQLP